MAAQRPGGSERVGFVLGDHHRLVGELADVEGRMVDVLDTLGLVELVCGIPGLSAVGAATILAETGDLHRFDSGRAVVKLAGLCPRDNASGTSQGTTRISGAVGLGCVWRPSGWCGQRCGCTVGTCSGESAGGSTNAVSEK